MDFDNVNPCICGEKRAREMPSRQHHYVPKFYLKRFSKDTKRINIYNIRRKLAKENVSLRQQCSKPNYYKDQNIENALSRMEAEAALALQHPD